MDGEIGSDGDEDGIDDIGHIDGGLNEFGGEVDGKNAPSFISIQLSLYPSLFFWYDGIIDVDDVLEVVVDDNDGFVSFPSFGDDTISSSSLFLLLLLNLLLFGIFGNKLDGEIVVDDMDDNDGLSGERDEDNDDGNVGDCCGCIQPPPYI